MIAIILIAIAALFIPLAIAYDLNSFFQDEVEKKLANIKNPLRFRILLSIYLKNYFRVGRDNMGLFHIYYKRIDPKLGEYWVKYQSLDVEEFNHTRVYLDNLRDGKEIRIKGKREKTLCFPRPRKVYNDFVIY